MEVFYLQKMEMERKAKSLQQTSESQMDTLSEERARELTNIMNSCTISINKAINNLVQEVLNLQATERNELIETVKSLNAKLPLTEPVLNPVDSHSHQNIVGLDSHNRTIPDSEELDISQTGDQEEGHVFSVKEEDNDLVDSKLKHMNDEKKREEKSPIDLDDQKENQDTLFKNPKIPIGTKSQIETSKDDKLKCEQCTFETSTIRNMNRHRGRIHIMKEKQFKCDQCSFKSKYKESLNQHIKCIHAKESNKEFKCKKCPYATIYNWNLITHIKRNHMAKEDKSFRCDQCPYATAVKENFNLTQNDHMQKWRRESSSVTSVPMQQFLSQL